jgi:hypothetical protein
MQKYNNKNKSYAPDVLIRGKGAYYNEPSHWYRQTGSDYGNSNQIIHAKFRPASWDKTLEYEVMFDGSRGCDLIKGEQFTLKLNRLNVAGAVISSRDVLSMGVSVRNRVCPFCNNTVIHNSLKDQWKCSNPVCQFDYSSHTCDIMFNNFHEMNKESMDKGRAFFKNFSALGGLKSTGDMEVNQIYNKL